MILSYGYRQLHRYLKNSDNTDHDAMQRKYNTKSTNIVCSLANI